MTPWVIEFSIKNAILYNGMYDRNHINALTGKGCYAKIKPINMIG